MSKKLREGTLNEAESDEVWVDDESHADEGEEEYATDIQAESLTVVKSLNVDQWVAVYYHDDGKWYPGTVQQVRMLTLS